jgi:hypothetical protein
VDGDVICFSHERDCSRESQPKNRHGVTDWVSFLAALDNFDDVPSAWERICRPAGFDGIPAVGFWSLEHVKI